MRLKLVPSNTSINFLKFHRLAVLFSSMLIAGSIGLFTIVGLNLGIDFKFFWGGRWWFPSLGQGSL